MSVCHKTYLFIRGHNAVGEIQEHRILTVFDFKVNVNFTKTLLLVVKIEKILCTINFKQKCNNNLKAFF